MTGDAVNYTLALSGEGGVGSEDGFVQRPQGTEGREWAHAYDRVRVLGSRSPGPVHLHSGSYAPPTPSTADSVLRLVYRTHPSPHPILDDKIIQR